MFGRILTTKSTKNYSESVEMLREAIENADAIVIGAGAGLSTSAGFTYSGERFEKYFGDFQQKYGFSDMYSGGFFPFKSPEEMWCFWSRFIFVNRYMDAPGTVYADLLEVVKDKNYFVITTNVDHCFQKAGFDKNRLFYTQGDYGLFQCSEPCHDETYDNEQIVREMVYSQKNMRIPPELIPKCPHCGKPMTMNLRSDDRFVEDAGWHKAADRYNEFIDNLSGNVLFLELGVGYNTPGIIKYPFWQMTAKNPDAVYAVVNHGQAVCPREIEDRSIVIDGDISDVIKNIIKKAGS
ncbi:MAG: Sir2 silent information regulator family NAD-dependent deacetylase [Lachnospiraceae bacterium]|nr:Sir2 silent information regulator family NAD-dependent deacetylase [Lachnospiraceae bacterium]